MDPETLALRAQAAELSGQAVAQRTGLFGGPTPNLRIGNRTLSAAFDRTSQERTIEEAGFRYLADAVAHIPLATGLTEADLPLGLAITHVPTGERYRIETRRAQPLSGYIRVVLRRINGQTFAAPSL